MFESLTRSESLVHCSQINGSPLSMRELPRVTVFIFSLQECRISQFQRNIRRPSSTVLQSCKLPLRDGSKVAHTLTNCTRVSRTLCMPKPAILAAGKSESSPRSKSLRLSEKFSSTWDLPQAHREFTRRGGRRPNRPQTTTISRFSPNNSKSPQS